VGADLVPRGKHPDTGLRQPVGPVPLGDVERSSQPMPIEHFGDTLVENVAIIPTRRDDHYIARLSRLELGIGVVSNACQ
jgi:hypothetical protein